MIPSGATTGVSSQRPQPSARRGVPATWRRALGTYRLPGIGFLLSLLLSVVSASAQGTTTVTVEWDPNTESDLAGYFVSVGTTAGVPEQQINVGLATSCTVTVAADRPRLVWVQAFNQSGMISPPSNLVEIAVPEARPPADDDGDGLPDEWESKFQVHDALQDPDGDGVSNLDEWKLQTDPWLPNQWFLAEGSTGYFDARLALVNPGDVPASGTIVVHPPGEERRIPFAVSARSRTTIDLGEALGLNVAFTFSARVETTHGGVFVERTMRWPRQQAGGPFAGHTGKGIPALSGTWYFAEGDTRDSDTFLLLANESDAVAMPAVDFVAMDGTTISRTYTIAPRSRVSILANAIDGLAAGPFWMRVQSTVPIAAERSMYLRRGNSWVGGDVSAGATAPSSSWYFSEGATGFTFDTWLRLVNPQSSSVTASITWLQSGASPVRETRTLAPGSRTDIQVDAIAGLSSTTLATVVSSSGPIIVERSMYWPWFASTWLEDHTRIGTPRLGTRWVLAEGEIGGAQSYETYLMLANPGPAAAMATITVLREVGEPLTFAVNVAAESRATVRLRDVGLGARERFGLQVDSTEPIAVERSIYWSGEGFYTRGGTNESGYRIR